MDDAAIVTLYHSRDPEAIAATEQRYGRYCYAIARNILPQPEDAEECVNDTYLAAWNAMPPHRPARLSTFLGKLTRNLAFTRYQAANAAKRGGGELPLVLDELEELISGTDSEPADRLALQDALNGFLAELRSNQRTIFLRRYWYCESVKDIARALGMSENSVSAALGRLRRRLKDHLTEKEILL